MNIKVLGAGCKDCTVLVEMVEGLMKELSLDATLEKVSEIEKIMGYGVMKTPTLVVNEVVKISGRVPGKEEVKKVLLEG